MLLQMSVLIHLFKMDIGVNQVLLGMSPILKSQREVELIAHWLGLSPQLIIWMITLFFGKSWTSTTILMFFF